MFIYSVYRYKHMYLVNFNFLVVDSGTAVYELVETTQESRHVASSWREKDSRCINNSNPVLTNVLDLHL